MQVVASPSLVQLVMRVALAVPFWRSGILKWSGFLKLSDTATTLFSDEFMLHLPGGPYHFPAPTVMAFLSGSGEILFPILLVLGLGTRFAALGLDVRAANSRAAPTSSTPSCYGDSRRSTGCSAGSCARPTKYGVVFGRCSSARACWRFSRSSVRSASGSPAVRGRPRSSTTPAAAAVRRSTRRSRSATTSRTASRWRASGFFGAGNRCRSSR